MVGMISFSSLLYWEVRHVSFPPAQLLQVRHALAQQQATQVAAQQAEIQKRIEGRFEAEATKRAEELVNLEKEKQKQKSAHDTNTTKQAEDDTTSITTSRGSAGGRSQDAR